MEPFYELPSTMTQTTLSAVASLLVCHPLLTVTSREAMSAFPSLLFPQSEPYMMND